MNLRRVGVAALVVAAVGIAGCADSSHQTSTHDAKALLPSTESTHQVADKSMACSDGLLWRDGGPVQHDPEVFVVFWGQEWDKEKVIQSDVVSTLKRLDGSRWGNILTQYCDGQGHIHNDIHVGGTWVDRGQPVDSSFTESQEVDRAIRVNHWKTGPDSQIMLFLPGNWNADDNTCGFHDITNGGIAYSEISGPDVRGGCAEKSDRDGGIIVTATHEIAEIATDPTADDAGFGDDDGYEIADLCEEKADVVVGKMHIAQLWSNRDNKCVSENSGLN